jgi:hypothetical protein
MSISGISNNSSIYSSPSAAANRQNLPSGSGLDTSSSASGLLSDDPAVQDFQNFMTETPAQRMQDAWLRQHGISAADFAAMSPDDKQKLLDQMKQEIEAKLKEKLDRGANAAAIKAPAGSTNILV